ncbi:hypothetical protein I6A84_05570 [Frankia sp. CNm7]|uniref:Uncharacterized protein n=1 Tax=Frankia nepalensis TaxID=1836974 RepID=A0A937UWJ9_9ACTN|nr:hypothetical protein [Frankia nepalensis]MBL7495972.1 hypothetical protein [Frankia nepalensis]MBL7513333.1 hypothetical protein [Frankia nepalensis]MBL7517608.1 hypothetical protein [Frankia nepalensis]MBL7633481.1 hypothetical protein [Frankia nepalensis]
MADVSVRFAMTDDSEIVLNLSLTQAIRLTEAIASKVSQAMTEQPRGLGGSMTGSMPAGMGGGLNGTGAYPPAVRPGAYGGA